LHTFHKSDWLFVTLTPLASSEDDEFCAQCRVYVHALHHSVCHEHPHDQVKQLQLIWDGRCMFALVCGYSPFRVRAGRTIGSWLCAAGRE
jgi:hypothetical protein